MKCPNKKDPDFVKLVEQFGELEAYALYIGNDYEIPGTETITESSLTGLDLVSANKLKSVSNLADKILASLIAKEQYYNKKGDKAYVATLSKQIDEFEEATIAKKMLLYMRNIDTVIDKFKVAQKASKYDLALLNEMNDFMSTYDYLDDIIAELKNNDIESFNKRSDKLNLIKAKVADLKQNYTYYAKEVLIEQISKGFEAVRAKHLESYEREFQDNTPERTSTLSKADWKAERAKYVAKKADENNAKIQLETKAYVRELATLAPIDISDLVKMLRDGRSISDPMIRYASKLLDNAAFDTRKSFTEDFAEAEKVIEEFIKGSNNSTITDHKKLYNNMIEEVNGEYTGFYTREFYSDFYTEFYKDKRELYEKLEEFKAKGEVNKKIAAIKKFKTKYFKSQSPKLSDLSQVKEKYKNPQFKKMTPNQKKAYDYLVKFNSDSDALTPSNKLNYRLPAINKHGYERLTEGNLVQSAKDSISDAFTVKAYDTDLYGDLENVDGKVRQLASQGRGGFKSIAIPFRGAITSKNQSYDLFGMALKNRYASLTFANSHKIKDSLDALLHILGQRNLVNHSGGRGLMNSITRLGVERDEMIEIQDEVKGADSNSYAALASIIEDRLYGKHNIPSNWGDISIDKISGHLIKFSANMMLISKVGAATANTLNGKVMNFLEAVKGLHYNRADLRYGEASYGGDLSNMINDVGSIRSKSKTNQLSHLFFGEAGMFEPMDVNGSQSSKVKRLLSMKTLHGLNTTAEHYISGTLMYAVLNATKVIDQATGRYVTSSGELTDNRADAIGMDKGYSLSKKGVYEFNNDWTIEGYTSVNSEAEQAISRKLTTILANLQGNYDPSNKAMIERYWYGKQAIFLRRWIVRGMDRRWRGGSNMLKNIEDLELHQRRYNENTGEFEEGTYVTSVRFFRNMIKGSKEFKTAIMGMEWDKLTDSEKANVRSAAAEMMMMLGAFSASALLALLAGKIDDDDEELKNAVYFLSYVTRRTYGELMFYVPLNPMEALRIMSTPATTMSTIESLSRLSHQILSDLFNLEFEKYKSGEHEYEEKSVNLLNKTFNPFRRDDYEKKDKYLKGENR